MNMKKLVIIQTVSPSYRNKLYHDLSIRLKDDFHLYSGDTYFEDSVKSDVSFAKRKKITNLFFLKRRLLIQLGLGSIVTSNNVLVLEMNPRIISNWIILLIRNLLRRKTVLWGHAWPREGKKSSSDRIRGLMRSLGNEIIVYTKTQQIELQEKMPNKTIHAACNSLMKIDEMVTNDSDHQTIENIIYVGRLTDRKKPLLLIKSFHLILERLPKKVKLLIVGEGPEKLRIDQYINQHNLQLRIKTFGHLDDYDTLKKLYFSSLFSVSPGYVGLSVTQSFGFGVPMLVSKNENHSPEIEAVEKGKNAVFFKTDDTESLGKEMVKMYTMKDFWRNQRSSIVGNCKSQYSIESMSDVFINIYKNILNSKFE